MTTELREERLNTVYNNVMKFQKGDIELKGLSHSLAGEAGARENVAQRVLQDSIETAMKKHPKDQEMLDQLTAWQRKGPDYAHEVTHPALQKAVAAERDVVKHVEERHLWDAISKNVPHMSPIKAAKKPLLEPGIATKALDNAALEMMTDRANLHRGELGLKHYLGKVEPEHPKHGQSFNGTIIARQGDMVLQHAGTKGVVAHNIADQDLNSRSMMQVGAKLNAAYIGIKSPVGGHVIGVEKQMLVQPAPEHIQGLAKAQQQQQIQR